MSEVSEQPRSNPVISKAAKMFLAGAMVGGVGGVVATEVATNVQQEQATRDVSVQELNSAVNSYVNQNIEIGFWTNLQSIVRGTSRENPDDFFSTEKFASNGVESARGIDYYADKQKRGNPNISVFLTEPADGKGKSVQITLGIGSDGNVASRNKNAEITTLSLDQRENMASDAFIIPTELRETSWDSVPGNVPPLAAQRSFTTSGGVHYYQYVSYEGMSLRIDLPPSK